VEARRDRQERGRVIVILLRGRFIRAAPSITTQVRRSLAGTRAFLVARRAIAITSTASTAAEPGGTAGFELRGITTVHGAAGISLGAATPPRQSPSRGHPCWW
jgi:hypothetical protein